jgi:cholesterol transport system auxiliary component
MTMRITAVLLCLMLLAGCASAPGIPETSYFRLPPIPPTPALSGQRLDTPIMVDTFLADGVHSDQALLYSTDPEGERLRAYHYQLWVDPPTRMLQRRLIATLRQAEVAPVVAGRLPPRASMWRVNGRIEAFERIRRPDGWYVQVALQLRVDHSDAAMPALLRDYREMRPAGGETVRDSVRAFGAAVDSIYATFLSDLQRATSTEAAP